MRASHLDCSLRRIDYSAHRKVAAMARHDSPERPAALMTQALTGPVAQAQSVAGIPVVGEAARLPVAAGPAR